MSGSQVHLTDKQRALIYFIEQYIAEHKQAPTLQEMATRFGVSKVTVLQHLRALERKKVVKRQPYATRTIEIHSEFLARPHRPRVELPFLGTISAGQPLGSFPVPDTFDLAGLLETQRECVVLRVKGDSMKDDHIRDGDFAILERRDWAKDGEVVVAILSSGEATLKRWFREESGVRLQPANAEAPALHVKEARVFGVLVGILRKT